MITFPFRYGLIFLLFVSLKANAQIWLTGMSDPILNETFGHGESVIGSALPAQKTNLPFTNRNCPASGEYTIVKNNTACSGDVWQTFYRDHTSQFNSLEEDGYMMLVNASSYSPLVYYVDTIRNLCQNIPYLFSAWINTAGICGENIEPVNIAFRVETTNGNLLKQVAFGDPGLFLFDNLLKSVGTYITLLNGESDIVIKLVNANPHFGGCGNLIAIDDIQFRPTGPDITAIIDNYSGRSKHVCYSDNSFVSFSASVAVGYTKPAYQWQESDDGSLSWFDIPGASALSYTRQFGKPGRYLFKLRAGEAENITNPNCTNASNSLEVLVDSVPDAFQVSSNSPVCAGQLIQFKGEGGSTYSWYGPNGFTSNYAYPTIGVSSLQDSGWYYATTKSQGGCIAYDSVKVDVVEAPQVSLTDSLIVCEGASIQLSAYGGTKYKWSPPTGLTATDISDPVASPESTTKYSVEVSNGAGCTTTVSQEIVVRIKPSVSINPDSIAIRAGDKIQLHGTTGSNIVRFYWTPTTGMTESNSLMPVVSPQETTIYQLHIVSSDSLCNTASADVYVHVYQRVFVPSAFTPNGDGRNDKLMIRGLDSYPDASVSIYNRYGQIIFTSTGYSNPWDGNFRNYSLPPGVYIYRIDLKNNTPLLQGTITLIR